MPPPDVSCMFQQISNTLVLLVELRLLPGLAQRLALVAALIIALALSGGAGAYFLDPYPSETFWQATWWAFLHLTDPGYLGADTGALRRVVATFLTVAGLVVFVGLLVAVVTQWLVHRLASFERGVTRVPFEHHIVVLGWTNRTIPIVRELLGSRERAAKLMEERGGRTLRVVVVDDEVDHEMHLSLRDGLGASFDGRRVLLRYGSPLKLEHLERVNLVEACAIVVPAVAELDAAQVSSDAQVLKTLMVLNEAVSDVPIGRRPLVVAELFDPSKRRIAAAAYDGPLELLSTERFLAQVIAQTLRHTGLSHVYNDLLSHRAGDQIYAPLEAGLVGLTFDEARRSVSAGLLMGTAITKVDSTWALCPSPDVLIAADSRLIVLARSLEDCAPLSKPRATSVGTRRHAPPFGPQSQPRRILMLGWGRKLPSVIRELDSVDGEHCTIDVASAVDPEVRRKALRRSGAALHNSTVTMIEAEFTSRWDLESLEPWTYDDILIAASDWIEDADEADARAVMGYLMLREVLEGQECQPDILVELLDGASAPLLGSAKHEIIVGPTLVSNMLANVTLRRELAPVFGDIFTAGGSEIRFAPPSRYGIEEKTLSFFSIADAVAATGDVALGVRKSGNAADALGGCEVNPPGLREFALAVDDAVIVLTLVDEPPRGVER
jgi:CBS domain-containing protein